MEIGCIECICVAVYYFITKDGMALNIRNRDTERLATELALLTKESKTEAVTKALRERLETLEIVAVDV